MVSRLVRKSAARPLSLPMIAMSSGIRSPASEMARIAPIAISSYPARYAVAIFVGREVTLYHVLVIRGGNVWQ